LVLLACLPAVPPFHRGVRVSHPGHVARQAQDLLAASNVIVDETLHGVADVKAFSNEAHETERYRAANQRYLDVAFKLVNGRALMVAFIIFALMGAITLGGVVRCPASRSGRNCAGGFHFSSPLFPRSSPERSGRCRN